MKRKINGSTIQFTFDNGLAGVTFNAGRASAATKAYAEMHGWNARIGDGAALSRKQKDGTVITITEQMRRDEIVRLVEHYESGTPDWELGRKEFIDPRAVKLAEAKGISVNEAKVILAKIEMDALNAAMSA